LQARDQYIRDSQQLSSRYTPQQLAQYGLPYAGTPYGGTPYGGTPYGGSPYLQSVAPTAPPSTLPSTQHTPMPSSRPSPQQTPNWTPQESPRLRRRSTESTIGGTGPRQRGRRSSDQGSAPRSRRSSGGGGGGFVVSREEVDLHLRSFMSQHPQKIGMDRPQITKDFFTISGTIIVLTMGITRGLGFVPITIASYTLAIKIVF
jgi:hypothetical protein